MLRICCMILLCYVRGTNTAQADCKVSSYGTHFVFGFFDLPYINRSDRSVSRPDLSILASSRSGTDIHISLQSKNTDSASKTPTEVTTTYYVYQNKEISFNSSFINQYRNKSTGGVIKITSDSPISLMALYKFADTNNNHIKIHPILPTNALSSSYVIPSYEGNTNYHSKNKFMLVGLNDSTSVRFEGYETGSMVYTVDRNKVFMYEREVDFSSTTAESNHPVAIYSYITIGQVTTMPSNSYDRSLTMQVPPLDQNAVHFVVPSLPGGSVDRYKVRIYASSQNAVVQIHSTSAHTETVHVYHKIFYELDADGSDILEILSDSPLVVVQIALNSYRQALFMTEIPAVSQYLNSYYVGFPSGIFPASPSTKIIITIPSKEVSGLLIDRKPIIHNSSQLKKSPLGNFTILTRSASSTVSVTHAGSEHFGVLALGQWQTDINHGFGSTHVYEAYGFQAGMQFTKPGCGSVSPSGQVVG
ncbi:uncharacterized protein LOC123540932 [Mercenaria mercenaria]|uniref:uncharacterized protein LOC123540932 n=1 Tax=Mercenaria mercenaria TaxID=6596 RepID=UPI00234FB586|nr:uncharacterized protein LOC123540932 [Mercenaria mercenaria]